MLSTYSRILWPRLKIYRHLEASPLPSSNSAVRDCTVKYAKYASLTQVLVFLSKVTVSWANSYVRHHSQCEWVLFRMRTTNTVRGYG